MRMSRIEYVRRNNLDETDENVIAFLRNEISASELNDRMQEKACGGEPNGYEL